MTLFPLIPIRYQLDIRLYWVKKKSMKDSDLVFDYVQLLYYKWHKINVNCVGSYVDSPDWIENKRTKINPISKKDNK